MFGRKTGWGLVLTVVCLIGAAVAHAQTIHAARAGLNGNTLRFVLEADQKLDASVFTLDAPDRVVIDLPPVTTRTDLNKIAVQDTNPILARVRSARFSPTKHRIVLDLKQPVQVNTFTIPPEGNARHRLVFDLTPAGKTKPSVNRLSDAEGKKRGDAIRDDYVPAAVFEVTPPRRTVVIIDPGHGGVDPGAIGQTFKTREKDIVLQVARRMKALLDRTPGYEAHLTRNSDVFVRLGDRVRKAQNHGGNLFVSLHADAHTDRRISGGSVYVLSERASDREAERLARIANEGDLFAGIDLSNEPKEVQNILIDLTQRETLNESARLARQLVLGMERNNVKLRSRKTKFAGFMVLKAPEIPSVLVEMAYISNADDERNLRNRDYQEKLAQGLVEGIKAFIEGHKSN
jgi:N-acetylmuramoyl-L-alanine amidase